MALLMIAPLFAFIAPVSSDPVQDENLDLTRNLRWSFDDPGNYTMTNTVVSGGFGTLEYRNETVLENTQGSYLLGTRYQAADIWSYPGSIIVNRTDLPVYNITLQPGPEGVDTYIREDSPNNNYGDSTTLSVDSENNKEIRTLIRFDLATIPSSAIILNATLHLYLKNSRDPVVSFNIYALSTGFNEMVADWEFCDIGQRWNTAGGDYYPVSFIAGQIENVQGAHSWDLSRLVDLWVAGGIANSGLIIVPDSAAGDAIKNFYSSDEGGRVEQRPKLTVKYTLPLGVATYESRALGPGTDSLFTLASYISGNMSLASDDFAGPSLSQRWRWHLDPSLGAGSYDVGVTTPGWLHVVGEGNRELVDDNLGANYLYQNISKGFSARTSLNTSFSANPMGAGMLVVEDARNWIGLYLTGQGVNSKIAVQETVEGVSSSRANINWGVEAAYLRVDRVGSRLDLYYGTDGSSWNLAYSHTPTLPYSSMLQVGLCMFSGTSSANPIADFDFFTVNSLGTSMNLEVRARLGNSTSLADPSWEPWGSPLPSASGSVLGQPSRYVQYQVVMITYQEWVTPMFSGFECHYERYSPSGTIETEDMSVSHLRRWLTITTSEQLVNGMVSYSYSVDHGGTWKPLITGVSNSISDTQPFMKIRIAVTTANTLTTPRADAVVATYSVSASSFSVVAPATVVAGEPFSFTLEARDEYGRTLTHWTGAVTLTAMNESGSALATSTLSIANAWISSLGSVVVSNEVYTAAETIRIMAAAEGASGMSGQITVLPTAVASVTISPVIGEVPEFSDNDFVATAYDIYGNEVTNASFSWTAEAAIGTLNTTEGRQVTLTTGVGRQSGYLSATSNGITSELFLEVVPPMFAPQFSGTIVAQVKPEDYGSWIINITGIVSDAEDSDSELRWYLTNEDIVSVSGENRTGHMEIELSTEKDVFGTATLRLVVVDSDGMTAETFFDVTITPVNDGPTIDHITPLVVTAGETYVYNFRYYVHDVDNPYEELWLSVDEASVTYATVSWLSISFSYPLSMNGTTQYVVVTVSDGELDSSTVVRITVSDDQVPLSTDLPDLIMNQGQTILEYFNLANYFDDPDGDMLYYASGNVHVQVTINVNHTVDFVAPIDWWGVEHVVFSATDPEGARAEEAMTVTVNHVNQPPTIEGVPNLKVRYDLRYEFDLSPYISDPDADVDLLAVTTDDTHIAVIGIVLSMLYPRSMNGTTVPVMITVSDGEFADSMSIQVTVSEDTPPVALNPPDHSFLEDVPTSYPVGSALDDHFEDPDGTGALSYYAFVKSDNVTATAIEITSGTWIVEFDTDDDFCGLVPLTIRAADPEGALAEITIALDIIPVPDAPYWTADMPTELQVYENQQVALDLSLYVDDPDLEDTTFDFYVESTESEHLDITGSVLMLEFTDFLGRKENSKSVQVQLRVVDPASLMNTTTMTVIVLKDESFGIERNEWLYVGMILMGGTAFGLFMVAMGMRRRPFLIRDMMLIHNDGFLIGRYATPKEGEIDENIMSGMLTAVLNFVEDSTGTGQQELKTFGFREYQVLVERAQKVFVAVVYEGDSPEGIDGMLKEFLGTVDRVYKKKLANWTGDIETDFAGVEVLIQAFVKLHSKKVKPGGGAIWTRPIKRKVRAMKVTVNTISGNISRGEKGPRKRTRRIKQARK